MTEPGAVPRLHVVAPDRALARPDFLPEAARMLDRGAGAVAVHLRLRETPARTVHHVARSLSRAAEVHGGWCVVNGRVDVALTAGAQAVQLGAGAMPLPVVRELVGRGTALGASVHSPAEGRRAERRGANYLLLGTIFESPSHPNREGAGPARVARCVRRTSRPVVAIGGMTPGRVGRVRDAGAHGVATLSRVWDAPDPVEAVEAFLRALDAPGARRREPLGTRNTVDPNREEPR